MLSLKLLKRLGLAAFAFSMFAPAAMAAPVKDAAGTLYVDQLTPSGQALIEFPNATKSINVASNACGYLVIRNSASNPLALVTSLTLNGTAATVPSATTIDTVPRCTNGVADATRSGPFRTAAGDFVFPAQTPLDQFVVGFPGTTLDRKVNINACGFVALKTSPQYPLDGTIKVNGTTITVASVPVGNPPICRNNVLYMPQ